MTPPSPPAPTEEERDEAAELIADLMRMSSVELTSATAVQFVAQALATARSEGRAAGLEEAAKACDVRATSSRVNQDRCIRGSDAYYYCESIAETWEAAAEEVRLLAAKALAATEAP